MMSVVNGLLEEIPIPKMVTVKQLFDTEKIENIEETLQTQLESLDLDSIKPDMSIAITAGSRGIANLPTIVKGVADFLKSYGAKPFVIAAMGSHGGATKQGQLDVLHHYGITEESVGCPVCATMDVARVDQLDDGQVVYMNRLAYDADGIVVINRIKPHTSFRANYESGVMKMMAVGLGCQKGAESCHRQGIAQLGYHVEAFATSILQNTNVLFGVGLVENAYDQTALIQAMKPDEIPKMEPELLKIAKKKMAKLQFDQVDVLIVDEIGKNISGEGMDPNITGRFAVPNMDGGIKSKMLCVLDLTEETLGNAVGLGMADVCTEKAAMKMDRNATYPNSLTSTVTPLCRIPMYFDNDTLTVQAAIKMVYGRSPEDVTVIRIKDTLSMETIEISESLLAAASEKSTIEILGTPQKMKLD